MALNWDKLSKQEPQGCVETSIGSLCIFNININDHIELHKKLGRPVKNSTPDEYLRNLAVFICYPESDLTEGKYKPDAPILSLDDTTKLSSTDVEKIAKIYVEGNDYLYKKLGSKKKKNDKDETVHYSEYTEIEHQKNDDESYLVYLHRLSIIRDDEHKIMLEKMFGSKSLLNSFSTKLSDNIINTLSWGDSLSKSLERISPVIKTGINPIPDFPMFDLTGIEQTEKNIRFEPFNKLAIRLDQLIEISAQTSKFTIEANKTQTKIAAEIKSGSNITEKYSRRNILLSIVVIVLTSLSILFAVGFNSSNKYFEENRLSRLGKYADSIVTELSLMNHNVDMGNNESVKLLEHIVKEMEGFTKKSTTYDRIIEQNIELTNELRKMNNEHEKQIEMLTHKVNELENNLKNVNE